MQTTLTIDDKLFQEAANLVSVRNPNLLVEMASLLPGEFELTDWSSAGLNVVTAVKRGIYTINRSLVIKGVGKPSSSDSERVESSLHNWLGF